VAYGTVSDLVVARLADRGVEGVAPMYRALGREETDLGRRALAHLRRARATEVFDAPR
jgi:hypothetical protein